MPRSTAGFSLVELMVVVTIISMLMALSVPSYNRLQKKSRAAAVANDFRVFTAVLQAHAHEDGSWPAESPAGVVPSVITSDDIQLETWTNPNVIGGTFDWDYQQIHNGVRYTACLALVDTPGSPLLIDPELFQEIDAILDDGNLSTGNFQLMDDNSLVFILEP
jgi:prepilin-type N-terminal cleavage/methylation domain-containing protein